MMAFLGLYCGGSYPLLTEITIHCTGVDTLSLAFGMEMVAAGLGYLVAPPLAGGCWGNVGLVCVMWWVLGECGAGVHDLVGVGGMWGWYV